MSSPLDPHTASPVELRDRIAAERRGRPFLVHRNDDAAQVITELERDRVTIGRKEENDVRLDWDGEVSRVHAALERFGAEWMISDDGLSRNGTWVNGERLVGRRRLRDGDVIALGNSTVAFCDPDDAPSSQSTLSAHGPGLGPLLTPTQRRVLIALCRPFAEASIAAPATNQQIADELVLSVDAVKSTLKLLFAAFGVGDLPQNQKRATLAQAALRSGVVTRRDL